MNALLRTNLLLLALAGILAELMWLKPGIEATRPIPITTIDTGNISSIKVMHREKQHLSISRDDSGIWHLLQPVNAILPIERVDKLLHIATMPSLHEYAVDADRLNEFGLNQPLYRLQLDEHIIEFGDIEPVTRLRFVRTGNKIHLVSDGYTQYLIASPEQWLQP